MMKRISVSLLALLTAQGAASAADLPANKGPSTPPPPIFSWDGVYVGIHNGYGFNAISEQASDFNPVYSGLNNAVFDQNSYSSRGPLTGMHFGYNKQFGSWVFGGEAGVTYAGQNTSKTTFGTLGLATGAPVQTHIQDSYRWEMRGRGGYADGRSLYYLVGGMVSGGTSYQHFYWSPTAVAPTPYNPGADYPNGGQYLAQRFGWTVGAGLEYAITNNWTLSLEYDHNDFGTASFTSTQYPGLNFHERAQENSVRLGVNYLTGLPLFVYDRPSDPNWTPYPPVTVAPKPPPEDPTFLGRLYHAYADDRGYSAPWSDPNGPSGRRSYFQPQPLTTPPYPYIDYAFGATQTIGAVLPNSYEAPVMKAISPTPVGKFLEDWHTQIYGWINPGFNISSSRSMPGSPQGGNNPAAYSYQPNVLQLDQLVLNIERLPDEVQKDHWDWGFHFSPFYGETYRYTTAFGFLSDQLQKWNLFAGFDMPQAYGEIYVPYPFEGMNIRVGRFITFPDIEAQLSPNNYMYSHSMTYVFDNYTSTGAAVTVQVNPEWIFQFSLTGGTEDQYNNGRSIFLPPVQGGILYQELPGVWNVTTAQGYYKGKVDPGVQPSYAACARYQTPSTYDNVYLCAQGINNATWGYNNLNWYGFSYFHKFNDQWHFAAEGWHIHQNNVTNINSPTYNTLAGAPNPFYYQVNAPSAAQCQGINPTCTAREWATVVYLNYQFSPLDNISWRAEYFNDINGQRTGTKTDYFNYAMSWQHWFSPMVEVRPEIAWYNSLKAPAFAQSAPLLGNTGTKSQITVFSADLLWHF